MHMHTCEIEKKNYIFIYFIDSLAKKRLLHKQGIFPCRIAAILRKENFVNIVHNKIH